MEGEEGKEGEVGVNKEVQLKKIEAMLDTTKVSERKVLYKPILSKRPTAERLREGALKLHT